jgi:F-type H+-transporting ATPase subunit b
MSQKKLRKKTMAFDATFWVGISFVLFLGGLIYLKAPQKINELLNKLISDIKNEIDESEKLRYEAKNLLDNAQNKLDGANSESNEILNQAKKDSEKLVIEMNDKFHKTAEIKKRSAETKIVQMKETALKEIRDTSVKIAMESVKKIISTSVDKSKLDVLFKKNLEEAKAELKKINS